MSVLRQMNTEHKLMVNGVLLEIGKYLTVAPGLQPPFLLLRPIVPLQLITILQFQQTKLLMN